MVLEKLECSPRGVGDHVHHTVSKPGMGTWKREPRLKEPFMVAWPIREGVGFLGAKDRSSISP